MESLLITKWNNRFNKVLIFGIFSTLFFSSYVLFSSPFEFYFSYLVVVLLLPFLLIKFPFPSKMLMLFGLLLLFGIINVLSGSNTFSLFFKIFINIIISSLFYHYIFYIFDFDIERIFGLYMKGAVIVAVIGAIQVLSYKAGFVKGYDFRWIFNKWSVVHGGIMGIRLNSVFSEPSYYGASMGPAFCIALYNLTRKRNLFIKKWQSIVICLTYFLTSSTVAYAGVFITLLLLLVNFGFIRYIVIFLPIMIGSYILLYNNNEEFRERVNGLDELYSGETSSAFDVHGSSFVQYNNYHVAVENFIRNPLYGTGLGSHQLAYDKYSLTKSYGGIYDFNKQDGNSMALRLMSETGLFGLGFMLIFIIKYFVRKNEEVNNELYWIVSAGALVMILLQLFRQGNYTYNGFFFYMWLYYFTYIKNREQFEEQKSSVPSMLLADGDEAAT